MKILLLLALLSLCGCSSVTTALLSEIPDGSYKTVSLKAYASFGSASLDATNLVKNGAALTATSYNLQINSPFSPVLVVSANGDSPVPLAIPTK